jgi:hypothetical protein
MPAYKFDYYVPSAMTLSAKHYSSVDHWGYFNGKSNAIGSDNTLGFTPGLLALQQLEIFPSI